MDLLQKPRDTLFSFFSRRSAPVLAVLMAFAVIVASEYSYRNTKLSLTDGIALTDQRVAIAKLMQSMTDAETGQMAFLLTNNSDFLLPYQQAMSELPSLRAAVIPFLMSENPVLGRQATEIIDLKLNEMEVTLDLFQKGETELAADIIKAGAGRQWMGNFKKLVNTELTSAAQRQADVRVSIYDSLFNNRVAVIVLTLLSLLGFYVFTRQLQRQQLERLSTQDKLEKAVEKRTQELKELTNYLETVREEEKSHMARELHDELGSLLTVAKLDLEKLRKQPQVTPEVKIRVERIASQLDEVILLKRRMIENMRPSSLSLLGLRPALEQLCSDMQKLLDIDFEVSLQDVSLPASTELVLYRFVQEALTNIAKYSQAKKVSVLLAKDGTTLGLTVQDDGLGFDPDEVGSGHHGLAGMRYRISSIDGSFTVISSPGQGATLKAELAC